MYNVKPRRVNLCVYVLRGIRMETEQVRASSQLMTSFDNNCDW